jgi:hypothetical protein
MTSIVENPIYAGEADKERPAVLANNGSHEKLE